MKRDLFKALLAVLLGFVIYVVGYVVVEGKEEFTKNAPKFLGGTPDTKIKKYITLPIGHGKGDLKLTLVEDFGNIFESDCVVQFKGCYFNKSGQTWAQNDCLTGLMSMSLKVKDVDPASHLIYGTEWYGTGFDPLMGNQKYDHVVDLSQQVKLGLINDNPKYNYYHGKCDDIKAAFEKVVKASVVNPVSNATPRPADTNPLNQPPTSKAIGSELTR